VLQHLKGDKASFQKKRRKGYKREWSQTISHQIVIEGITAAGAKKEAALRKRQKLVPKKSV
jgi:hypothetical protein